MSRRVRRGSRIRYVRMRYIGTVRMLMRRMMMVRTRLGWISMIPRHSLIVWGICGKVLN